MAQNFIACDREQALLLPPSLREWLPQDHLAWFVLDAVEAMDLSGFLAGYREDGWGRARRSRAFVGAMSGRWGALFGDVLELCAEAGLVRVEVIAVDEGARQRVPACQP